MHSNLLIKSAIIGCISFSLLFTSCRNSREESNNRSIHIRLAKEPDLLNPLLNPKAIAREVNQYIFLALADFNGETQSLEPVLIKSIPSSVEILDGQYKGMHSYTFEILESAKWSDGKDVTAEDYLFTLKSIIHPETNAASFRSYANNIVDVIVDKNNNKKGTVFFNKYYFLEKELALNIEVYPKHLYDPKSRLEKYQYKDLKNPEIYKSLASQDTLLTVFANEYNSNTYGRDIVEGAGPYLFGSWNAGQLITLTKKKNYWANDFKLPYFQANADQMLIHIVPDETAAITALKSGEIDVMSGVSSKSFKALENDKNVSSNFDFLTPQLMKYYYILMNNQDPLLSSATTRKALASLTDVDRFIKDLEDGLGVRTIGPFNPAKRYYHNKLTPINYDISKAKALLEADGWKDTDNNGIIDKVIKGKKMQFKIQAFVTGDLGKSMLLIMKEAFGQCGIDLDIVAKDFAQISKENISTGKFQLVTASASQDVVDDDPSLRFLSKNGIIGGSNYSGYQSVQADSMIELITSTADLQKRDEAYMKLQEIIYDDQPYIFLYVPTDKIIVNKRWKGKAYAKRPGYAANTFTFQPQFEKISAN